MVATGGSEIDADRCSGCGLQVQGGRDGCHAVFDEARYCDLALTMGQGRQRSGQDVRR